MELFGLVLPLAIFTLRLRAKLKGLRSVGVFFLQIKHFLIKNSLTKCVKKMSLKQVTFVFQLEEECQDPVVHL